jgi:hypothetical protein
MGRKNEMKWNAAQGKPFRKMKSLQTFSRVMAISLLFTGAWVWAQVAGTVTNKTTGKPAAGDSVALVDTQAGMSEVARTTTDAHGHYQLTKPGSSSYQVRVTHQGLPSLIAAPDGNAAGDLSVYEVAAHVTGVYIETDVLRIESAGGRLRVTERYLVHNTSSPPTTQWSARSFQVFLPPEAVVGSASAQRPGGASASLKLTPDGPKGHYDVNFPIQPDDGDKGTRFQIEYKVPYDSGKFTFRPQFSLPAQSVSVTVPRSMAFAAGSESAFQSISESSSFQTFAARNATPGKVLEFTVSAAEGQQNGERSATAGTADSRSDKGFGSPFDTSTDPLSKFKWWILSGLLILLAAATAFLMRKSPEGAVSSGGAAPPHASPEARSADLQKSIRDELSALERERAAGALTPAEYAELKTSLETVLRRMQKKGSPPPAPGE